MVSARSSFVDCGPSSTSEQLIAARRSGFVDENAASHNRSNGSGGPRHSSVSLSVRASTQNAFCNTSKVLPIVVVEDLVSTRSSMQPETVVYLRTKALAVITVDRVTIECQAVPPTLSLDFIRRKQDHPRQHPLR